MANSNFTVMVATAFVAAFQEEVMEAARNSDVLLQKVQANGCKQIWALKGYEKPKPSVIGYETGKVVFQNLNPTRIGLDVKVIHKWSNMPKAK